MKRRIITTADGSKTIHLEDWNEQYHSKHGAVQEAYHVFIKHGLQSFSNQRIAILEVGFGTGLNALITLKEAPRLGLDILYTGVEAFPINNAELEGLNYTEMLNAKALDEAFLSMHSAPWEEHVALTPNFSLIKMQKRFQEINAVGLFDLIYFDAFGARVQPELWTAAIFQKMYNALSDEGVLVTYSAKGSVRRALQEVGFRVERLPGPPGKREMLRALKTISVS